MKKSLFLISLIVATSSLVAAPKSKSLMQPDRRDVAGSVILDKEGIELIYPKTIVLDNVVITPLEEDKPITGVETDRDDLKK